MPPPSSSATAPPLPPVSQIRTTTIILLAILAAPFLFFGGIALAIAPDLLIPPLEHTPISESLNHNKILHACYFLGLSLVGLLIVELVEQSYRMFCEHNLHSDTLIPPRTFHIVTLTLRIILAVVIPSINWLAPRMSDGLVLPYAVLFLVSSETFLISFLHFHRLPTRLPHPFRNPGRVLRDTFVILLLSILFTNTIMFLTRFTPSSHAALALATFAAIAWTALLELTRRNRFALLHRLQNHQCLACGYDLRATPSRCPECGTPKTTPNPDSLQFLSK